MTSIAVIVVLVVFGILVDQVSKMLAKDVYLNTGTIFSLAWPNWLVAILAVIVLLAYMADFKPGVSLILAGGAGNLIDRLIYDGVRDIFFLGTLAFNLADLFVLIGLGLLCYHFLWSATLNKAV